ncbi:DNA (cytosine-5-)-methyltransferase [Nocardia caishijiensis]|uniref:DNA (cytosine-5-)-methyltransferase n=1 Tax=Nocardia caishijiensis TaxID=184756 RepID=A0ABQ6YQR2_9NOCA|nr:DNA (cytosine-5-)-methyltransferase [Nocardia caishijiensis]KAF0848142.1 DNA mismatch endonuclease Vsr [Nocardia caishijiensis]
MITPPSPPLRAIDLFCGAGGLSEGFRAAGYEIGFALDKDKDSCETYKKNHPGTHVECASITDFSPEEIKELAGGRVDVVLGGPSCQSFSTHGRRTRWVGEGDERNNLWEHMFKVVEHLEPKAFLLENVPGMVYFKQGSFGKMILDRFAEKGYAVHEPEILLAADWGVPQRRRRLFIVGLLGDVEFEFPKQTHMGGWRRDSLEMWEQRRREEGLLEHLTVWDAIGDLPPLGDTQGPARRYAMRLKDVPSIAQSLRRGSSLLRDHEVPVMAPDTRDLIKHVPEGGTWRDIPPYLLPDRYRGMRRTDSTNLLGRLDRDLPAYTITTQFSNVTTGCFTHPVENRSLTVREGARIQTFPDRYKFVGSLGSRCRQIGNAVPPLLAHVLAHAIAAQIGGPGAAEAHPAPEPPIRGQWGNHRSTDAEIAYARRRRDTQQDTLATRLLQAELRKHCIPFDVTTEAHGAPRTGDIMLKAAQVVVMVNSCFWNGCPEHAATTKSRTKWWAKKIAENQERNRRTEKYWRSDGWDVVVNWEHEHPDDVVRHVNELIDAKVHVIADHAFKEPVPTLFEL